MKKGILMLAVIGMLLVSCSGAWAYSFTFSSILTDSPGTASLTVNIWSPNDPDPLNTTYFGSGYFGYIYSLTNNNYDTYITDFVVGTDPLTPVTWVASPTGWTWNPFAGQMKWFAQSGYQIPNGGTASGFEIKSAYEPSGTWTQAWNGGFSPANGKTLGPGIPEPASAMLLGFGLIGLVGRVVRKKVRA